jgi:hypothetical protein
LLFIIIFLGQIGAAVYIFMEVIPDLGLLRQSSMRFHGERESVTRKGWSGKPAAGNYEELAELYLEERNFLRARECSRQSHQVASGLAGHILSARYR